MQARNSLLRQGDDPSPLKAKGMCSYSPGQTQDMERSPFKTNCKEGVWGHHGGCCHSGTAAYAQAAQLFQPRSRHPKAVTEQLSCLASSWLMQPWCPSSSLFLSLPSLEKYSNKVGQWRCSLFVQMWTKQLS